MKTVKYLIFLCYYLLLISIQISFAQDQDVLDDLYQVLDKTEIDTQKVDIYNELAWQYLNNDTTKSYSFAKQGLELAKKINFLRGQGDSFARLGVLAKNRADYTTALKLYENSLLTRTQLKDTIGILNILNGQGNIYRLQGLIDSSIVFYEKGKSIAQKGNYFKKLATFYQSLGTIYREKGEYQKSLDYYLQCLNIRKKESSQNDLASIYNDIALIYDNLGLYEEALQRIDTALLIYKKENNGLGLAKVWHNKGTIYSNQNKYSLALIYLKRSDSIYSILGKQYELATVYLNKGFSYYKLNQFTEALNYYQQSLKVQENIKDSVHLAITHKNIGKIYEEQGDLATAKQYYKSSLGIARSIGTQLTEARALHNLGFLAKKEQNWQKAVNYFADYIRLRDSLEVNIEKAQEIIYLRDDEERVELADYAEKAKQAKQEALIVALLALIGLILAGLWALSNRQKKLAAENQALTLQKEKEAAEKNKIAANNRALTLEKQKKEAEQKIEKIIKDQSLDAAYAKLKGQDEERDRIAKELHDGLGGKLFGMKMHFQTLSKLDKLKEEHKKHYTKMNKLLDEAYQEVRQVSHKMNVGTIANFDLTAQLQALADTIQHANQQKISIVTYGLEERLPTPTEIELYLIIQELITNILKHAQATEITIQINRYNGTLNLLVEDDGIGFDTTSPDYKPGIGLSNIEARVHKLSGTLHIDSSKGNGTTVSIDVPI